MYVLYLNKIYDIIHEQPKTKFVFYGPFIY